MRLTAEYALQAQSKRASKSCKLTLVPAPSHNHLALAQYCLIANSVDVDATRASYPMD